MCSRWLRRLLVVLLLASCGSVVAAPQGAGNARQAWQLLDYIAVDYTKAVVNGKVVSQSEYAEMREFSVTARARIAALADNPQRVALLEQSDALVQLVAQHAPSDVVASAAHALANEVLAAYGVVAAPRQTPDLQEAATLYAAQCAACHGASGAGDGAAGVNLDPAPIAFTDALRAAQRSPLALYEAISHGVSGTAMPAFAQLSDAQRWALAFYVGGMAFDGRQQQAGERLWATDAALRGALPSLDALSRSSPAQLAHMLDTQQAAAITAYLRAHPAVLAAPASAPATLDVRRQLEATLHAYAQRDDRRAAALALSAYLEGVEPVEPMLAARDAGLLREIETAMGQLRSDIGVGAALAVIQADAAHASRLFARADAALHATRGNATAAFLGSFTILLREGLEALLVVVGMIAFLRRSERREALPWVHAGWLLALLAGGLTWALATWLIDISGTNRELTEGVSSVFAALVLLSVGIWMHQKSLAGRWQQYLHARMSAALGRRSMLFLFVLAFVAVYREVFETILFYAAMWTPQDAHAIVGGLAAGVGVLTLIAWGLLKLGMRLPIGKFFNWSSILIAVLAVVLAGKGVAALQEAGWVGLGIVNAPRIDWLGLFPTWQTLLAQGIVLAVAVVGFWVNQRGGQHARHA